MGNTYGKTIPKQAWLLWWFNIFNPPANSELFDVLSIWPMPRCWETMCFWTQGSVLEFSAMATESYRNHSRPYHEIHLCCGKSWLPNTVDFILQPFCLKSRKISNNSNPNDTNYTSKSFFWGQEPGKPDFLGESPHGWFNYHWSGPVRQRRLHHFLLKTWPQIPPEGPDSPPKFCACPDWSGPSQGWTHHHLSITGGKVDPMFPGTRLPYPEDIMDQFEISGKIFISNMIHMMRYMRINMYIVCIYISIWVCLKIGYL